MAVSPGSRVIIAMMPIVGWLVSRMDSRKMVAAGFLILAYSLYLMSHFTLEVDFKTILVTRIVQSFGISLIFVPISTMAYAFISREMRSAAASLMSFGRNAGSSVGIAFSASMMVRHTQIQQNHLVEHFTPLDPGYSEALRRTTERFAGQSGDWTQALAQARALFYGILQEQASVLAFGDVYRFLAVSVIVVLPLVFLIKKTTGPS